MNKYTNVINLLLSLKMMLYINVDILFSIYHK